MSKKNTELSNLLTELRNKRGYTIEKLVEASGVSRSPIMGAENDRSISLLKLAQAYRDTLNPSESEWIEIFIAWASTHGYLVDDKKSKSLAKKIAKKSLNSSSESMEIFENIQSLPPDHRALAGKVVQLIKKSPQTRAMLSAFVCQVD